MYNTFSRSPLKRWVGSKYNFLKTIFELLPNDFNNVYEPFCGSAVFSLNLVTRYKQDRRVMISDNNYGLITFFEHLKTNPASLIQLLGEYSSLLATHQNYEFIKNEYNYNKSQQKNTIYLARQFLYLHYTCFNGLYRENSAGYFNVPIGKKNNGELLKFKIDKGDLIDTCINLKKIYVRLGTYNCLIDAKVQRKDLVFLDPPYYNNFAKYTKLDFQHKDHVKLIETVHQLNDLGCYFILCSNDNLFYRQMLKDFRLLELYCNGCINSDTSNRQKVKELLFTNIN